jgi:hypothetical protein
MPQPEVYQVIADFRRELANREASQFAVMTRRWLDIEQALSARIDILANEIDAMRLRGEPVNQSKIMRLENYKSLLSQTAAEVGRYQDYATRLIADQQRDYARLGIDQARAQIRAAYIQAGRSVARFDLLPIEAVENMVGLAGDGKPLFSVLSQRALTPEAIDGLTTALIRAVAMGDNPKTTAKKMKDGLTQGLTKALTIARTEQLRAFREAGRQQAEKSGVVTGWIRRSALQARTCLACLSLDGKEYSISEPMDDHPNGRCFQEFIIKDVPPSQVETGAEWFDRQSEKTQRAMMGTIGKDVYQGWKDGRFEFSDLSKMRHSDTWGDTATTATQAELLK